MLFNPQYSYCDWPVNVHCGDSTTTVATSTTQPTFASTTSSGTAGPVTDDPEYCADKANGLYAHADCGKYYQCYHDGRTAVISCFAGTLFNVQIQSCDWAANVNCESDPTDATSTASTTTTTKATTTTTTVTTASTGNTPTVPPTDDQDFCSGKSDGWYAHADCQKYYQCYNQGK